ncbi:MAG: MarR family transcriptional regulator [Ignavibacteriae bacterium]|nr:MarR family transcriptional regulator [Ignavibacteriota bacterium]
MHNPKKIKYNFNDSFGFIVVKTGRLIENRLRYNFEDENISITPQQWSVLTYLWNEDGISQQKIANVFSKDKTSMTRLLNNMEKNGFIIRQQGVKDKRNKNIFLTERSKELKEKSIKVAEETLAEIIDGVDTVNLKISKNILKEICTNINRL